ncbi:MAG TPA: TlpA disulfide reductase family protein [Opitutaceae bacterium]
MWFLNDNLTDVMRRACVLATLAGIGALLTPPAHARVESGAPFPTLSHFPADGSIPSYQGKVTLVDFWASWCAPCRTSFPALSKLRGQYSDDVAIIGISIDENASDYAQFIHRFKPTFSTVRDVSQKIVATVEVPTMPTSYLLDRHGVVRFVHIGFHDNTPAELQHEIDQLLKETP